MTHELAMSIISVATVLVLAVGLSIVIERFRKRKARRALRRAAELVKDWQPRKD